MCTVMKVAERRRGGDGGECSQAATTYQGGTERPLTVFLLAEAVVFLWQASVCVVMGVSWRGEAVVMVRIVQQPPRHIKERPRVFYCVPVSWRGDVAWREEFSGEGLHVRTSVSLEAV